MGKDDNAKNKFLTGFTLVEMLVSIGIMAIIFTIAALNLNARKPGVLVENAAREFLSQLQFAKNLALTGAVFRDEDDPDDGQLDVPFGYGLHFFNDAGSNQYFIFGDLYGPDSAGNKKYDSEDEHADWGDFTIDSKVNIEITYDESPAVYPVDVFFETLNGYIYYFYNEGANKIQAKFSYTDDPIIAQTVIILKNTNQIYLEE